MARIHQIVPCLWFDDQGEEAAQFYTRVFKNSRVGRVSRYSAVGKEVHGREPGSVMTVEFELNGQPFVALNGGPAFTFNEAISFQVMCEDQQEVDRFWEQLGAGGDERAHQCGWLKDRYGVSWQIIPKVLLEMIADQSSEKGQRAMAAMLQMKKIDIATLQQAYAGETASRV